MLRRALIFLAATSLSSCGGASAGVTMSTAFLPHERVALGDVVQEWNDVAIDRISLEGGVWQLRRETPPNGFAGWTDARAHVVMLAPDLDDPEFRITARHEFGHVLRLHHLADERSVMHPGAPVDSFSRCDLVECVRAGACMQRFDFAASDCPRSQ